MSISPILQVGVKPGQLVAVHQVLGVAEVWQWVSVVAQVRQSVSMVVSTFHHGIQQGVLAVSCRVSPVGSVWKAKGRFRQLFQSNVQYSHTTCNALNLNLKIRCAQASN